MTTSDAIILLRYKRLEDAEREETIAQLTKVHYAMRKRDEEAERQYAFEHSKGYCPHCFSLIALNGKCMSGCDD